MKAFRWIVLLGLLMGLAMPVSLSSGGWEGVQAAPLFDAFPPSVPSNPTPGDGATGVSVNQVLSWQGGDDADVPVTYEVYVSTNPAGPWNAGTLRCSGGVSKSCTLWIPMATMTTYYWKVRAIDSTSATTDGPVWAFTTEKPCFQLTLSVFAGSGLAPIASPLKSGNCTMNGYYNPGEVVSLTASPAVGWEVQDWSNTANDTSTSVNNSLIMPAGPLTAQVTYRMTCYTLTANHTGQGADPSIVTGTTCVTGGGQPGFHYGDAVTLAGAIPAPGWVRSSWTGLGFPSTAAGPTFNMPAMNHTVTVNYTASCHTLTLTHTGTGSDPSPSPVKSPSCSMNGQYVPGQVVTLTAVPDTLNGWVVDSWTGTDNDPSTATTNTVTMGSVNHTAAVNYTINPVSGSLPINITLQGRPAAPNATWATPLTVTLTKPGDPLPSYTYLVTTDTSGNTTLSNLVPGTYHVAVKNIRSLRVMVPNKVILSGSNPTLAMGLLREGDTNNDNIVNLTDFSLLSATYGKCSGAAGYDDRADFNRDTCVTISDFSLLSSNYLKVGS